MNKAKIVWLAVAAVLIVAGVLMCAAAVLAIDFNFEELSTQDFNIVSHEALTDFENIEIYAAECDVRFVLSPDNACRVTSVDGDGVYTDVMVDGGVLKLVRHDERRWYEHIGIWWGNEYPIEVTVYLPSTYYGDVDIRSASGNIQIGDDFTFRNLTVQSLSGDVRIESYAIDSASIKTTSGNIDVKCAIELEKCMMGEECTVRIESTSGDITVDGMSIGVLAVVAVSGDVTMEDVNAKELTVKTTSGDIELVNVLARATMEVSATSGDIEFYRADADSLNLKTVSGDIEGSLIFAKNFITDTVSGSVRVPESDPFAGNCTVSTTSGDIDISIVK